MWRVAEYCSVRVPRVSPSAAEDDHEHEYEGRLMPQGEFEFEDDLKFLKVLCVSAPLW